MITLVLQAFRFLVQLFTRAQASISAELNITRGRLSKLKDTETSEKLPDNPPMPQPKFSIQGADEAMRRLDDIQMDVERVLIPALKEHGAALCNDLIQNTPPLAGGASGTGGSPAAMASGRMMVEKQIRSIFKPVQKQMLFGHLVMAQEWRACEQYGWTPTSEGMIKDINNKNWKSVFQRFQRRGWKQSPQQIVEIPTPAAHRAARNPQGKTIKQYFVRRKEAITAYVARVNSLVGKMVSGWVDARNSLGVKPADGSNVPAKSLGMGTGSSSTTRSGRTSKVTITNVYGDLNGVLTNGSLLTNLINNRTLKMTRDFQKRVDDVVSRSNRRARK